MRNRYLSAGTTKAIDGQVAKVLRGLGNPEPPLRIEDVVELLKLDRQFYTTSQDGALRETYSRIKVGVLQIFERPTILLDAVRKMELRALYVPDRKRILIDEEAVPNLKVRFVTAHEITHHLCADWHEDVMFGDTDSTISETCHEQIECEANYGAGRLLTLQDHFAENVKGEVLTISRVQALAKLYSNTISSTLWRSIENLDVPAFALIGKHPQHDSANACKYFVRSRRFEKEFPCYNEADAVADVRAYCDWKHRGPMGNHEAIIEDAREEKHLFTFESFSTQYDTMTIAQLKRKALARSL